MHYLPRRRGGYGAAGAPVRQQSTAYHTGAYTDYLRRHELEAASAARGDKTTKQDFVTKFLPQTADPRNLRLAWDWIAGNGGQAPGTDGLRFDDLDETDVWPFLRTIRRLILHETYRTTHDRRKKIPKSSGKGYRRLTIPSIVDRLVQRAIVQTIQPYLDMFLDNNCLGFRPRSDTLTALARAEQLTVTGNCWVWLTEDLRNAFDNVPQRRLLDILRIHIPDERMMRLIERVVVSKTNRGLRQGSNLSPLLLNVDLDHFLDKKWHRQHPDTPLLRWAHDLLVLCRHMEEAHQAYQDLQRLLAPTGMTLKGTLEQAIHNLQGASADWLGYRLSKGENGLIAHVTETAWKSLTEKLEQDHEKDCSPLRVIQSIMGWISQLGPCFKYSDIDRTYAKIVALAHSQAFEEVPSKEQIRRAWRSASLRWRNIRKRN